MPTPGSIAVADLAAQVMTTAAGSESTADSADSATASLTGRMKAGDETAWREFHEAFAPRLERYLLVVCRGNEEAVHDVLQQTLLRAVRHLRVIATEAELWGWLTVLARSAAADLARRERRHLGFLERWFQAQPSPTIPEPSEADQRLEAALACELSQLPAADREILEQKYLSGGSVRELAETFGTTEKAVESRLTRARQKLRRALLRHLQNEND